MTNSGKLPILEFPSSTPSFNKRTRLSCSSWAWQDMILARSRKLR